MSQLARRAKHRRVLCLASTDGLGVLGPGLTGTVLLGDLRGVRDLRWVSGDEAGEGEEPRCAAHMSPAPGARGPSEVTEDLCCGDLGTPECGLVPGPRPGPAPPPGHVIFLARPPAGGGLVLLGRDTLVFYRVCVATLPSLNQIVTWIAEASKSSSQILSSQNWFVATFSSQS